MNIRKINLFGKEYNVFSDRCCGDTDKRTLYIEATKLCNAKCSFCSASKPSDDNLYSNILDLCKFRNTLDELMKNDIIESVSITGGEPLINPHLYDIFKMLDYYKLLYAVTTNGSLIDKYYDDLIYSNLKYLNISRNHYDIDKNDELFGVNIKYNLDRLLKNFKGSIRFNCVLTGEMNSLFSIEKYIEMTAKARVKYILFREDYFKPDESNKTTREFFATYGIRNIKESNKCICTDTIVNDIHIEFRKVCRELEENNEVSHSFIRNFVYKSNHLYGGWSDKSIQII
jgi:MoaA/NifB/PqqE/SkfB family radical SAM enzyme